MVFLTVFLLMNFFKCSILLDPILCIIAKYAGEEHSLILAAMKNESDIEMSRRDPLEILPFLISTGSLREYKAVKLDAIEQKLSFQIDGQFALKIDKALDDSIRNNHLKFLKYLQENRNQYFYNNLFHGLYLSRYELMKRIIRCKNTEMFHYFLNELFNWDSFEYFGLLRKYALQGNQEKIIFLLDEKIMKMRLKSVFLIISYLIGYFLLFHYQSTAV